jgi:hypothetical protein
VKKQSENIKLSNVKKNKQKNNPNLPTHLLIEWVSNAKQTILYFKGGLKV